MYPLTTNSMGNTLHLLATVTLGWGQAKTAFGMLQMLGIVPGIPETDETVPETSEFVELGIVPDCWNHHWEVRLSTWPLKGTAVNWRGVDVSYV
jgi:hypothetical protein